MRRRLGTLVIAAVSVAGMASACGSKQTKAIPPVAKAQSPAPAAAAESRQETPVATTKVDVDPCRPSEIERPIYFAFDSHELELSARDHLERIAACLGVLRTAIVRIAGHTDERGTTEYNVALAERRAVAARDYLLRLGIDRARILTVSYGEERPAIAGSDETSYQRNRRDEIDLDERPR